MKKFLNDPERAVDDALAGFVRAHSNLVRSDPEQRLCVRADAPVGGKVALVDSGIDDSGSAVLAELSKRSLTPDSVAAIFLTHGHHDHIAGIQALAERLAKRERLHFLRHVDRVIARMRPEHHAAASPNRRRKRTRTRASISTSRMQPARS